MSSNNRNERDIENSSKLEGYPDLAPHKEKLLILVKAPPAISTKYRELVCTVGITKNGKLIRLHPIDFRYMDFEKRYKKYQWVEMEIEKHQGDKRADSYRPKVSTISVASKPIPTTKKGWEERKSIVLPLVSKSLEELQSEWKRYNTSLGLFKPKDVSLKIEKGSEEWGEKQSSILKQGVLIGQKTKPLDKIPFKFSYEFRCNDSKCTVARHSLIIEDWEITELYRNMKSKYGYSIDLVLEKVKQKWEGEMWRGKQDSYLIVGTHSRFRTPMILGVFRPPTLIDSV